MKSDIGSERESMWSKTDVFRRRGSEGPGQIMTTPSEKTALRRSKRKLPPPSSRRERTSAVTWSSRRREHFVWPLKKKGPRESDHQIAACFNMWPLESIKSVMMECEQKKMQEVLNRVASQVVIGLLKAFLPPLHSNSPFIRLGNGCTEVLF